MTSDSPAAGNPASGIPEEAGRAALDAALTATAPMWGDVREHWRVRILSAALKAAEPLLLAAAGKLVSEEDVRRIAQESFDAQKAALLDEVARRTDERLERTAHLVRVAERARIRQLAMAEADRIQHGSHLDVDEYLAAGLRNFANLLDGDDS